MAVGKVLNIQSCIFLAQFIVFGLVFFKQFLENRNMHGLLFGQVEEEVLGVVWLPNHFSSSNVKSITVLFNADGYFNDFLSGVIHNKGFCQTKL